MAIGDRSALLGALEQLRLRLLDLSGRNRLTQLPTYGRQSPAILGRPAVEDLCIERFHYEGANRPSIAILGLPEPASGGDRSSATGVSLGPTRSNGRSVRECPPVVICRTPEST